MIENFDGEIYAPDDIGTMRIEVYSSTKIIGYDNYKKAYCGSFIKNQNSYMLDFIGRRPLSEESNQIVDDNCYRWKVFALALGENSLAFEYIIEKH